MLKIIFCILLMFCLNIHCSFYEIQELNDDSGLIIEKRPEVKIIRGHWKLVHYVDLSELEIVKQRLYLGVLELT